MTIMMLGITKQNGYVSWEDCVKGIEASAEFQLNDSIEGHI